MAKPREPNPVVDAMADRVLAHALGSLAANLRRRRAAAGKTQEAVAEECGVSAIYVQGIERGRGENPTLRIVALLAHAVRCRPSDLLADAEVGPTVSPGATRTSPAARAGAATKARAAKSTTRTRRGPGGRDA